MKICILIPYFGKLPASMYTYLLSCKMNKNINWIIFTNDVQSIKKYQNFCNNVSFVKSSLNKIRDRIKKITKINICLNKPYKLCDYKPLYGKIFSKYLINYDYWGYSDLDIVYGNLYKYIYPGLKNHYLKIGDMGHFTILKNTSSINNLYKKPIIKHNSKIYDFNDIVSKTDKICHFDEFNGLDLLCCQYHIRSYSPENLVNDISFENLDLKPRDNRFLSKYCCYIWNNGHADYYYKDSYNNIHMHEYGYFHFQKRHAFTNFIAYRSIHNNMFAITTHGYTKLNDINKGSILNTMNLNRSSYLYRIIYLLKWYILKKGFHINIKHVFKRIFIERNFKL